MCHFSRENAHLPANCINQMKGNIWRKKKYSPILYHYIAFYVTTYMSKSTAERNICISAVEKKTPLPPVCCPGTRGIPWAFRGGDIFSAARLSRPGCLSKFPATIPHPLPSTTTQDYLLTGSRQQKTACKRKWSAEWRQQCYGWFVGILCNLGFSFGLGLVWL